MLDRDDPLPPLPRRHGPGTAGAADAGCVPVVRKAADRRVGARRKRSRLRGWWTTIHLWLGLSVGIVFALLGLTGSVLVFDHALDAAINPAVFEETGPTDEWASFDRMVASADRAVAGLAPPHRLVMPERPGWPLSVEYSGRERRIQVLVDPVTAEVRAVRKWGDGFATFIYWLHSALALGHTGETVVAVTGLLALVSLVSGVIVWWRKRRGSGRQSVPCQSGRGANG